MRVGPQNPNAGAGRRRKRSGSATNNAASYNDDFINLVLEIDDNFEPQWSATWPTPKDITELVATNACQDGMETSSIYATCIQKLDAQTITDLKDACVIDIKVTGIFVNKSILIAQCNASREVFTIESHDMTRCTKQW